MKKTLVPVGVLLLMASVSFSQSLSPTLLSSQSGYDTSKNMILEWTLGESAIETISEKNTIYSQGFIQPFLGSSKAFAQIVDEFLIFPNPVKTDLNVQLLSNSNSHVAIDIYDVNGRNIMQFERGFALSETIRLDVSDLPVGMYLVRISDTFGVIKNHKIIKN